MTYNDDGTVDTATAPANDGNPTDYRYNNRHQIVKVVPPDGNSLKPTTFTYDKWGRTRTVTDGRGVTTTYSHDLDGRVTKVSYDSHGATPVTYRLLLRRGG